MKIIILMTLFVLHIQDIYGDEDLLSKFHQSDFKIRDFRIQKISCDEKYFSVLEVKTFKYNRTTPAINITAQFKVTVQDKIEILVQGFKFLSNEYRHFPIRFQVNLKKAVSANMAGLMSGEEKCGYFGNNYFEKNIRYNLCNFVIDESRFPPLIPNGRYKFESKLLYFDDEIAFINTFVEIYTPITVKGKIK